MYWGWCVFRAQHGTQGNVSNACDPAFSYSGKIWGEGQWYSLWQWFWENFCVWFLIRGGNSDTSTPPLWVGYYSEQSLCWLLTASRGLIQTITTHTDSDMHCIASGLSNEDFSIKVWAKKRGVRIHEAQSANNFWWLSVAVWVVIIVLFLIRANFFSGFAHLLPVFKSN